jgi:CSLREA domain-containing protein
LISGGAYSIMPAMLRGRHRHVPLLAMGAAALLLAPEAGAKTYEVTSTADPQPGACTQGDCTLREALIEANASQGKDTIELRSKRRYELELVGVEDAAALGDLDVTSRVAIRASGSARATIDANGIDRVLHFFARGSIADLRITGGTFLSVGDRGAGIAAPDHRVDVRRSALVGNGTMLVGGTAAGGAYILGGGSIRRSEVRGNAAGSNAGGLWVGGEPGEPFRVEHTRITGNDAGSGPGGISARDAVVADTAITQNETVSGCGGASLAEAKLQRSGVRRNTSGGPGGGGACTSGVGASLEISDSTIARNITGGTGGGATFISANGSIERSTVARNEAAGGAGGVYAPTTQPLRVRGSTIARNTTTGDGGGILAQSAAELDIVNSTLARNSAEGIGGGIFAHNPSGGNPTEVVLEFSTIAFNTAASGGGVGANPPAFFEPRGTIVAANTGTVAFPDCAASTVDSRGRNLISDPSGCASFDHPTDVVDDAPKLHDLAGNGGPTATVALKKHSPAVDAGGRSCPGRDQRGEPRPQGGRCDVGAFER